MIFPFFWKQHLSWRKQDIIRLLSPLIHPTLGMNTNYVSTKLGFSFLVRYLGWGVTNCESSLTLVTKEVMKSRILFSMAASALPNFN